ncbi:MAG: trehalase family glycosidase [Acidobacteriota bacterium]
MKLNGIHLARTLLLAFAVIISLIDSQQAQTKRPAIKNPPDINNYLKNSVRADVGGEGLWLPQLDSKLTRWLDAEPGFVGQVYYVHATDFKGLFKYEFTSNGKPLTAKPIKNTWTPAYVKTRYQLNDASGAITFEIEETKFINDNEEVFSNLMVFNSSPSLSHTLSIRVIDLLRAGTSDQPKPDVSRASNTVQGHIRFKPTTYYFTDLQIEKFYLMNGSGFGSTLNADLTQPITINPKSTKQFSVRMIFGNSQKECADKLASAIKRNAFDARIAEFNQWFADSVPEFNCSDEAIKKMYYYRWYLVKKCSINTRKFVSNHPYRDRVIYEGVAGRWFTKVIGLPLPLQIMEARWLNDKSLANGQARVAITKDDFFDYLNWTPFAIWQLHLVAPNPELIKEALPVMKRFVASEEAKDEDQDFLPTTWGTWITGMEYQPSFHYFTVPRWDHTKGDEFVTDNHLTKDPTIYKKYLSVERVDEATYYFLNNLAIAKASAISGDSPTATDYLKRAENIRRAVKDKLWDERTQFFYDIHPTTDEKALEAKQADGFFPFLFGLLATKDEAAVFNHLLDPKAFWTAFPVPSASQDSPAFDAAGRWKVGPHASPDKPYSYVDSWNGPTWVFSNALVLDALANGARMTNDERLRTAWLELLNRHTKMQFRNNDLSVPCVVEHYNSHTGEPIRWLADYFHSSYNDLLMRFLIGITPREDGLIEIAPLARAPLRFSIKDVRYRGHKISVNFGRSISIAVDSKTIFHRPFIRRIIYNPKTGKFVS